SARRRFSLGSIGGPSLVMKLVKPGKVFSSRASVEFRVGQVLISEAQPEKRAAQTAVLGKADAAARQKLPRFDSPNGVFDEIAELLPLLIRNGGAQVLDLRRPLADEDDECDFRFACYPGVADQLRIKR